MTIEEYVKKAAQEEMGDLTLVTDRKTREAQESILLQKYGYAKPVLDKRINNPGWVPETSSEIGADIWKKRKQTWAYLIRQTKQLQRDNPSSPASN